MSIRFWGVRGSIPCPGPDTVRYGGNTSCVEVRCGESILVFDAGSGLRGLGSELTRAGKPTDVDLFLSHCHIDHLLGLPFYVPLFERGHRIRIWAGNVGPAGGVRQAVDKMMSYPLFPVDTGFASAILEFNDFAPGDALKPRPGIAVRTAGLNHPGGAIGYRVDYAGRSVAYLTDMEIGDGAIDQTLVNLSQNVDVLIMDTTYTNDELPSHEGWGHSSWQQGIQLANAAHAKVLCLFHHDPDHDDGMMDDIAEAAARTRAGTIVAKEGLVIDV